MVAVLFCLAAFAFAYAAGRRSLVAGLVTVFAVGYFYGILRANLPETASHFIFDAAVLGLYATQLLKRGSRAERRRTQLLGIWVGVLIAWPFLLFFVPMQDYAVQLVGLRGNIFLLPFLLLGARLKDDEVRRLALAIAVLNLVVFLFACAEYVGGVERFYPQNQVTQLIYMSAVDERFDSPDRLDALRIPATFTGAHAYAGTMTLTFAFLFGAWVQKRERHIWHRYLLAAAMAATVLAVFLAAARTPVIILTLMFIAILASGGAKRHGWAFLLALMLGVGYVVSSEERLQRFTTLRDVDFVGERVSWSVNDNFLDLAVEYPLGNGLGGGGTSIPYFLQGRVRPPEFYMENEYARIVLEQGMFGLCLWVGFIAWAFTRRATRRTDAWFLGRRLMWVVCAAFFASGMIGTGLMTSIPGSALILLGVGWIAVRQPRATGEEEAAEGRRGVETLQTLARHYG
ncbi:MAG TPA: O-antigen ligase family protein [Pyrinomonadaceae bacterium]|nr:O-antigen ligase family protein [Pyrinomonadaceae bacterium]